MRSPALVLALLLPAAAAAAGDLSGRAILSYQTYDAPEYDSDGFNQLYELRLERQITQPFRLRLSVRAEDARGDTDFGRGPVQLRSTQLQPGAELLYSVPKFEGQLLYDRIGYNSGPGVPASDRTLTRQLARLLWTPDALPHFSLTSEKRGTEDPSALVDQTETRDEGIVSYGFRGLVASGILRRTTLDDGQASFARQTVDKQGLLTQDGSYLGGRLTTSFTGNLLDSTIDDRAGANAAAVPNPVPIARAEWVVDDTPLDSRDRTPVGVPGLLDGNLDTPTQIQLGPDGSSFQNLILDFGHAADVDTVRVVVRDVAGQLLRFGGSVTWDVYTSPDGDRWSPLAGSTTSFSTSLSLYEVRFPSTHVRWLKVVSFSTNAVDTRVSELQAFVTTQLGPDDTLRTDLLVGSGSAAVSLRPTDKTTLTYYGLYNGLRQTSELRPKQANHGLDQLIGAQVDPFRWLDLLLRYEDRWLNDTSGFDQSFDGWTGDLQFRFLPSMQQTVEASRLDEVTAGRRSLTTTYTLRTYTRFYSTWDLTLDLGTQDQDFTDLAFRTRRNFLSGVSQAQLTRALKLTLTAALQHTNLFGQPIDVRPEDTPIPPERDDRWTVELFYRAGPQLGVSGRWGRAHTSLAPATIQNYHLDWYPFPGGSVRIGGQYDQDLDTLGQRLARRVTFTPAWTVNRHVLINVNYTFLGVTGPQAGNTRSFFVAMTVTM
ncbi:MAG TPA: hypothetical protein VMX54_00775 [Vicinamibacteria bacterium]|nr:hypothetical protein [Vicinamibacteria bacterium]